MLDPVLIRTPLASADHTVPGVVGTRSCAFRTLNGGERSAHIPAENLSTVRLAFHSPLSAGLGDYRMHEALSLARQPIHYRNTDMLARETRL